MPLDGGPFADNASLNFSYEPKRTNEYDICRRIAAEIPV